MSSGCGDVLSLEDLKIAKLHQLFEAEVITGKSGGVAGGADIDYATNQVTGQVQKTMPAILRDIGYESASFDFASGGTLSTGDRNKAVLWPLSAGGDGDYYYWEGVLPKVIPAGSTPGSTGGIAEGAWRPVGDVLLRDQLISPTGSPLVSDHKVSMQSGGRLSDIINYVTPEQFGAKGDGINDDTAAIQSAIDYVAAQGGGKVLLGSKTYRASGLVRKPMVYIEGMGVNVSTIKAPDAWNAAAVIIDDGFAAYEAAADSTIPGCFGGGLLHMYIDGNKDNFSGTPSKMIGNGILLGGTGVTVQHVEIQNVPATGFVKLNYAGSPNQHPSYWPLDKGQWAVNTNNDICVKWCGNDCMFVHDSDAVYQKVLAGLPAMGVGTQVKSHWDSTRTCAAIHLNTGGDFSQFHAYGYHGGWGIVLGSSDYSVYPAIFRMVNIIIESVSNPLWARPSSFVMGTNFDIHSFSMTQSLPEIGSAFGTYSPGVFIESGRWISGVSERRYASNYGVIRIYNVGSSQSNPTVGSQGTHVFFGGENNTAEFQIQRSLFMNPELGGLALMYGGVNNTIKSGSFISGFLGTDSIGADSCGIQFQPNSSGTVDLDIHRCKVGIRWSTGLNIQGRISLKDNITGTLLVGASNMSLIQRSQLEINIPGGGGNRQIALSATGAVSVTASGQQTISVTGLNLPYVPLAGEVKAWTFNDLASAQGTYAEQQYVNYIASESSTTTLVFRVKINPVSGAAAGQRLAVKLN